MIIANCRFNREMVEQCYGREMIRAMGSRVIISSGAMIGTRDGILVWSNAMTKVRSSLLFPVSEKSK